MYMCVSRKVENELSLYLNTKIPRCIPKNKVKLCTCIWTLTTLLLFPLKLHPASVERQLIYIKCFVMMPIWYSKNLGKILCHQSFLLHCLSLTYWKLLPVLIWFEYLIFFPMILKTWSIWLLYSSQMLRQESL